MKILIITYAYRPDPYPRAFRWSAIAEHWAAQGHDVTVLAGFVGTAPHEERLDAVRVLRVGSSISSIRDRTSRSSSRGTAQTTAAMPGRSILKRLHDATWKKLYWPDYACLWYPAAKQAALKLATTEPFDAVISVSVPFTGHLVGRAVKRRRPALCWLVDIGDPFSFVEGASPNNPRLYGRLNRAAEHRILHGADAVAVTTEAARREYERLFTLPADKVHLIPPLLSLPPATPDEQDFYGPRAGRRLVFAGTMYRQIRSPAFMLQVFAELVRREPALELHILGSVNDCADMFEPYRELLGRNLFLHGTVSRNEASRALRAADILVNIGNDNEFQVPSKLVEYISTGLPILNVVAGDRDSSREFFAQYPACYSLRAGSAHSDAEVQRLLEFVLNARPAEAASLRRMLAPYETAPIASRYEDLLKCAS